MKDLEIYQAGIKSENTDKLKEKYKGLKSKLREVQDLM
jgi:hypothetical protein